MGRPAQINIYDEIFVGTMQPRGIELSIKRAEFLEDSVAETTPKRRRNDAETTSPVDVSRDTCASPMIDVGALTMHVHSCPTTPCSCPTRPTELGPP